MNKKLAKGICLIGFGLGLALMTAAPALANQIVVCQSCTTAPGGDPNIITNPSSFNMFVEGSGGSTVIPTLVIVAELGGGTPTISFPAGGADAPYATAGTFGLTLPGGTGVTFTSGDVMTTLGLAAGGSLNFTNLQSADNANGFGTPSSYTLFAFALPTTLGTTPIQLDTTAGAGSFIFGYGCQEATSSGTQCSPGGNIAQSVMTNGGLVPEPSSVLLLGAGLAGIGIWSWRRKALKV